MSENSDRWCRNVRLCLEDLFTRVEQVEDATGISPKAMHQRLSALEAQANGQAPAARQPYVREDVGSPGHVAGDRRGRLLLGGASGKLTGVGYRIDAAEARAAELRAQTKAAWATQAARKAGSVVPLRRAG